MVVFHQFDCFLKMNEQPPGFNIKIPFVNFLGIKFEKVETGRVIIGIKIKEDYKNSWGSAHGGLLMTMLDVALGSACRSLDENCNGAITVEIKVNFLRVPGNTLKAIGNAKRLGRSLIFSEGEIYDLDHNIIAKATGTFKLTYPGKKNEN